LLRDREVGDDQARKRDRGDEETCDLIGHPSISGGLNQCSIMPEIDAGLKGGRH
jgi:hypothetical protein